MLGWITSKLFIDDESDFVFEQLTDLSSPPDVENSKVTHENPLYAELLKRDKELESTLGTNLPTSNGSASSSDSIDSSPLVEIDL